MGQDTTSNESLEPNLFVWHCLMKRDGVDRMFPYGKRDNSEWGSRYEPNSI